MSEKVVAAMKFNCPECGEETTGGFSPSGIHYPLCQTCVDTGIERHKPERRAADELPEADFYGE